MVGDSGGPQGLPQARRALLIRTSPRCHDRVRAGVRFRHQKPFHKANGPQAPAHNLGLCESLAKIQWIYPQKRQSSARQPHRIISARYGSPSLSGVSLVANVMIETAQTYAGEIVAVAVVLLTWALDRWTKPRARLTYSIRHAFVHIVDQPLLDANGNTIRAKQEAQTASISVSNLGKETATGVEVTFNWKPPILNAWPNRHYEAKDSPEGRYTLVFDTLAPGESFGIEIMSINQVLPGLTAVRCNEATASDQPVILQPVFPPWKIALVNALVLIGIGTSGYLAVSLIRLISG